MESFIKKPLARRLILLGAGCLTLLPFGAAAQGPGTEPAPQAIRTKHATFEPAAFGDLPGWRDDSLGEAMAALKHSCGALRKRAAWEDACKRSATVASNDAALRQFFEQEFRLYQIRNIDGTPAGTITGYYEAQLNGSRRQAAPYLYPVYGVPDDMLYLDARTLPAGSAPVRVKIAGRNVLPLNEADSAGGAGYLLDLGTTQADTRTKRYRLRLDGQRVTHYFSRDEIAAGRMTAAKVIAWVDNPSALYSMQIQGSGKVRLPDGDIIRVAYGEQNGHPFMPSLQALPQLVDPGGKRQAITTRGLGQALQLTSDATAEGGSGAVVPPPVAGRGRDVDSVIASLMPGAPPDAPAKRPQVSQAAAPAAARKNEDIVAGLLMESRSKPAKPSKTVKAEAPPEPLAVPIAPQAVAQALPAAGVTEAKPDAVSALLAGEAAPAKSPAKSAPAKAKTRPQTAAARKAELAAALQEAESATPAPVAKVPLAQRPNTDPSYVFFRTISDNENGPIGALGVPLTAGRSLAVDPRTTPLGVPVFISTTEPGKNQALNRLMMAQDTGGAITGAVRADFFWGFGRAAFARASQMKQNGRMWLLLPKSLQLGVKPGGVLTRGIGGQTADCLVPDPELCVE